VIFSVGCINEFEMDVWCIFHKLMIMKNPNYDFDELVELVMQISELMKAFWVNEMFNIQ